MITGPRHRITTPLIMIEASTTIQSGRKWPKRLRIQALAVTKIMST